MANNNKEIVFLFGAGVSIPAKISSTNEISEIIFGTQDYENKQVIRGAAQNYFFDSFPNWKWNIYSTFPKRIQDFLYKLKVELEGHYIKMDRAINYEDVYYFLNFIFTNLNDVEGNPALKYLIKGLEPKIENLLIPLPSLPGHPINLERLSLESIRYIKQIVSKLLAKNAESFEGFNFLQQALTENDFELFSIFTLNHDVVLEQFFISSKNDFNDGFRKNKDDLSIWDPKTFDIESKIKLYKIHGSVNWDNSNPIYKRSEDIISNFDTIGNALILIGTYNKMSEYIKDIYLELYYRFYQTLYRQNTLIVVGYGFNDIGINQKIFNWINSSQNKIIIIDPAAEGMKSKFYSRFGSLWDENKRIRRISNYIENIYWDDIKSLL